MQNNCTCGVSYPNNILLSYLLYWALTKKSVGYRTFLIITDTYNINKINN